MTAAAVLALAAGVTAVLGVWEALVLVERARLPATLARVECRIEKGASSTAQCSSLASPASPEPKPS